jgi:hypothetical protein
MSKPKIDADYVEASFDLAERLDVGVASIVWRARLACAAVSLCEARRRLLRHCLEAEDGARAVASAGVQMVQDHCAGEISAFLTAWQKGTGVVANMRVIETAVEGYAQQFDLDDGTRAAVERMFLDFMRYATRRLPDPGRETSANQVDSNAADAALDWLESYLEALLEAHRVSGGEQTRQGVQMALRVAAEAAGTVLEHGYSLQRLRISLDWWCRAVGIPRIEMEVMGTSPVA